MTVNAKLEGVPLTFHGYFYSGEQGTIKLMTWTGQNLFHELKRFLAGFEILRGET